MQEMTGGERTLQVPGSTVRQLINNLDKQFPGVRARLCNEDGTDLLPGVAVIVDGETSQIGLLQRVEEDSEVHFLPAIGGG